VVIFSVLAIVAFVYLILLVVRLVIDWVQAFAREWRPRGAILVVAEAIYTTTDPPLLLLRRVIPPLRVGNVRLDLAFTVLFVVVWFLWGLFTALAAR
jgi:YggT family protein